MRAQSGVYYTWRQTPDANFRVGMKMNTMTSSTSNRHTSNIEDTIVEAGHSHSSAVSSALYYPSLIGSCWDDELLPSGD